MPGVPPHVPPQKSYGFSVTKLSSPELNVRLWGLRTGMIQIIPLPVRKVMIGCGYGTAECCLSLYFTLTSDVT